MESKTLNIEKIIESVKYEINRDWVSGKKLSKMEIVAMNTLLGPGLEILRKTLTDVSLKTYQQITFLMHNDLELKKEVKNTLNKLCSFMDKQSNLNDTFKEFIFLAKALKITGYIIIAFLGIVLAIAGGLVVMIFNNLDRITLFLNSFN